MHKCIFEIAFNLANPFETVKYIQFIGRVIPQNAAIAYVKAKWCFRVLVHDLVYGHVKDHPL